MLGRSSAWLLQATVTSRSFGLAYSLISTGRSVTFVMQKESSDSALEKWYRAELQRLKGARVAPLLKFFNAARVHTIHLGIVSPEKLQVQASDFKMNGLATAARPMMMFYRFEDIAAYIPGDSGGVFRLCEQYLTVLRQLVDRWLAQRTDLELR